MSERTCAECGGPLTGRQTVVCSKACRVARLRASDAYLLALTRHRSTPEAKATARAYQRRKVNACTTCGSGIRAESTFCQACRPRATPTRRMGVLARLSLAAKGTTGRRVWRCGPCAHCGTAFVSSVRTRGCSDACSLALKGEARRGRRRIRRFEVFERDRWMCWLCGFPTDSDQVVPHPDAPTVDHVVPQALGGTHDPDNLRCAHFKCNTERGIKPVAA